MLYVTVQNQMSQLKDQINGKTNRINDDISNQIKKYLNEDKGLFGWYQNQLISQPKLFYYKKNIVDSSR